MNGEVRGDPKNATVKIYHFTSDYYQFYLFLICSECKYKIKRNSLPYVISDP